MQTIRLEDRLRNHPSYFDIAKLAIEVRNNGQLVSVYFHEKFLFRDLQLSFSIAIFCFVGSSFAYGTVSNPTIWSSFHEISFPFGETVCL